MDTMVTGQLIQITKELARIADALEESNYMVKPFTK